MTRFTASKDYTTAQGTLTLKTRDELGHNLLAGKVLEHLSEARSRVLAAKQTLDGKELPWSAWFFASRYLLTDRPIAAKDLELIRTIVTKISNGLQSDVTLKVGQKVGRGDTAIWGAVRRVEGARGRKPYHTQVVNLDDDKLYRRGAMRIAQKAFEDESSRQGVVTLIHEASHKYAGTIDYCYFDADGLKPRGSFTEKSRALINADSYAWFVYYLSRDL